MKSKTIARDHRDLIRLNKSMTPEERLLAFYHHSRLMAQLAQTGKENLQNRKPFS